MRARLAFVMLALSLALASCTGARAAAGAGGGKGAKNCASCKRMCEVAADAQDNPAAVEKCKADCDQKCG